MQKTNKQESGIFGGKDGYSPACHYVSPRGICAGQIESETDNSQGSFGFAFLISFHHSYLLVHPYKADDMSPQ